MSGPARRAAGLGRRDDTRSSVLRKRGHAAADPEGQREAQAHVPRTAEAAALALCALLLGLFPWEASLVRHDTSAGISALGSLASAVWPIWLAAYWQCCWVAGEPDRRMPGT